MIKHDGPFSQQTFSLITVGKAQVLLMTLMALFYSSVPISHKSIVEAWLVHFNCAVFL